MFNTGMLYPPGTWIWVPLAWIWIQMTTSVSADEFVSISMISVPAAEGLDSNFHPFLNVLIFFFFNIFWALLLTLIDSQLFQRHTAHIWDLLPISNSFSTLTLHFRPVFLSFLKLVLDVFGLFSHVLVEIQMFFYYSKSISLSMNSIPLSISYR